MLKFLCKSFNVMGKALTGKLSSLMTGLVSGVVKILSCPWAGTAHT